MSDTIANLYQAAGGPVLIQSSEGQIVLASLPISNDWYQCTAMTQNGSQYISAVTILLLKGTIADWTLV